MADARDDRLTPREALGEGAKGSKGDGPNKLGSGAFAAPDGQQPAGKAPDGAAKSAAKGAGKKLAGKAIEAGAAAAGINAPEGSGEMVIDLASKAKNAKKGGGAGGEEGGGGDAKGSFTNSIMDSAFGGGKSKGGGIKNAALAGTSDAGGKDSFGSMFSSELDKSSSKKKEGGGGKKDQAKAVAGAATRAGLAAATGGASIAIEQGWIVFRKKILPILLLILLVVVAAIGAAMIGGQNGLDKQSGIYDDFCTSDKSGNAQSGSSGSGSNSAKAAPDGDYPPAEARLGSKEHFQPDSLRLFDAVAYHFGDRLETIGGWRADGGGFNDHPSGRALDIMIPNYSSPESVKLGTDINDFVLANAEKFGLEYTIWRQHYNPATGTGNQMDDRGSDTQNHFDHVHVTLIGDAAKTELKTVIPDGNGAAGGSGGGQGKDRAGSAAGEKDSSQREVGEEKDLFDDSGLDKSGALAGLTKNQIRNASMVVGKGKELNATKKEIITALITVSAETVFINYSNDGSDPRLKADQDPKELRKSMDNPLSDGLPSDHGLGHGGDHGSLGIMQQQYPWWGTVDELMNPGFASGKFYEKLLALPEEDRKSQDPWTLAQTVQQSAHSDGSNYRAQMEMGNALFEQLKDVDATTGSGMSIKNASGSSSICGNDTTEGSTKEGGANEVVAAAEKLDGTPFSFGDGSKNGPDDQNGDGTKGVDSAGLASYAFYQGASMEIGDTVSEQWDKTKQYKVDGPPKKGDLIFYGKDDKPTSVAVFAGSDKMWEVRYEGDKVSKTGYRDDPVGIVRPYDGFPRSGSNSPQSGGQQASGTVQIKGDMAIPLAGDGVQVTSGFGPRWGTIHPAIDFAASGNPDVLASMEGTVQNVITGCAPDSGGLGNNCGGGYGNQVFIDHGDGIVTHYSHLNATNVNTGDKVKAGAKIGVMGHTGSSTAAHLDYEFIKDGTKIDSLPVFNGKGFNLSAPDA